jgi:hypothetical protein
MVEPRVLGRRASGWRVGARQLWIREWGGIIARPDVEKGGEE